MRWAGNADRVQEMRTGSKILVAKPEGMKPLSGRKCRWKYNKKIRLRKIRF